MGVGEGFFGVGERFMGVNECRLYGGGWGGMEQVPTG